MNRLSLKGCGISLLDNKFADDFIIAEIVKPFIVSDGNWEVCGQASRKFAAVLAVEIIDDENTIFDGIEHTIV